MERYYMTDYKRVMCFRVEDYPKNPYPEDAKAEIVKCTACGFKVYILPQNKEYAPICLRCMKVALQTEIVDDIGMN